MRPFTSLIWPLLALPVGSFGAIVASDEVPLLGPSFLPNVNHSIAPNIARYIEKLFPMAVDGLFESKALNKKDLVFTVDVFSANTNRSLFNYHHVGEGQEKVLPSGQLNDQTVSRLAGVSKLFTAYAILAKGGMEVFGHPVTKYLPELRGGSPGNPLERIDWEDVTVGALASHQAGSGGIGDFISRYHLDNNKLTPPALLSFMRDEKKPVTPLSGNAVYSDGGYALLGQVLERLTGQTYEKAINDLIIKPLGLKSTSIKTPASNTNIINRAAIDINSTWDKNIPVTTPSDGLFANGADLRTLGLSILNSEILSPATIRAWMKPLSGTGSLVETVGAPWEISRLMPPVSNNTNRTRVADVYISSGANTDYAAVLALSPDHGIGFSILIGGSTASAARWPLRQVFGEAFVAAAELDAGESTKNNIAGTFAVKNPNGTNITLSVDEGHPGLGIKSLFVNGVQKVSDRFLLRLYPTGLNSVSRSLAYLYKSKPTMQVSYRLVITPNPPHPRADVEGGGIAGGLFDNQHAWMGIGAHGSADEIIFDLVEGRAERLMLGRTFEFKRAN